MGKGLNNLDDDWHNAWGSQYINDYDYYHDDYVAGNNYGGGLGNGSMMLERGDRREVDETEVKTKTATGERDPLRNTTRDEHIEIPNRYGEFTIDDDSDSDNDKDPHADTQTVDDELAGDTRDSMWQDNAGKYRKPKPNQQQRKRRKELHAMTPDDRHATAIGYQHDDDMTLTTQREQ